MKLRNKITGEVKEFVLFDGKNELQGGATLKDLMNEWEDYEETKEYWTISGAGYLWTTGHMSPDTINDLRRIGNLFESKEEAEKAVEKLKAWKRLKDKGFKIIGVRGIEKVIDFDIPKPYNHVCFDMYNANEDELEFYNDLLFLFGGEE